LGSSEESVVLVHAVGKSGLVYEINFIQNKIYLSIFTSQKSPDGGARTRLTAV